MRNGTSNFIGEDGISGIKPTDRISLKSKDSYCEVSQILNCIVIENADVFTFGDDISQALLNVKPSDIVKMEFSLTNETNKAVIIYKHLSICHVDDAISEDAKKAIDKGD